ncbi:putative aryl-alcohol dehydrogenase [Colletotrichum tropicale]|nr:putative aryl-alcohol dehydrogenase [Colletotrichum tropicale]
MINSGYQGRTVPTEFRHSKPAPKMPYVSRLILGMATYGTKKDRAWELGFNTFDTSNFYCNGISEEILGKFLKTVPRESVVGMTKHIFDNVKLALKRLDTDYIDVLQLHRFDYETPIEETMTALHDVVKAGYVRYIGISSCWAWQFHAMQNYALNNNLTPFVNCQNLYNLLYREEEREMMPLLKYLGVGSTPWSPLARGHLARPLSRAYETIRSTSDAFHDEGLLGAEWEKEVNRRVEQLAEKRGYNMAQIGLAWVLHKDVVAAPIVGVSKIERFEETLAALEIELSEKEIKFLEEPYQPRSTASFV